HYRRYAEDFRLLQELGHPAHRLSIEWSRIEPQQGQINQAEVEHYRRVLSTLRELGIEPWVTIHHFTSPLWFIRGGGFTRHAGMSQAIRAHAKRPPQIGITLAVQAQEPLNPDSAADRELAARRDAESNGVMFDALRAGVFAYPQRAPVEIAGLQQASTFVGV